MKTTLARLAGVNVCVCYASVNNTTSFANGIVVDFNSVGVTLNDAGFLAFVPMHRVYSIFERDTDSAAIADLQ